MLEATGEAMVGIAGTNFRETFVGKDEVSWAVYNNGKTLHRRAPDTVPSLLPCHTPSYLRPCLALAPLCRHKPHPPALRHF